MKRRLLGLAGLLFVAMVAVARPGAPVLRCLTTGQVTPLASESGGTLGVLPPDDCCGVELKAGPDGTARLGLVRAPCCVAQPEWERESPPAATARPASETLASLPAAPAALLLPPPARLTRPPALTAPVLRAPPVASAAPRSPPHAS